MILDLVIALEPVWTKHSLAACKPTPKKQIPKSTLLEILEFARGVPADSNLGAEGVLKTVQGLTTALEALNDRGHRGLALGLPPVWPQCGVYSLQVQSSTVKIIHKFLDPKFAAKVVSNEVCSEVHAMLVEEAGYVRFRVSQLFKDHIEEQDPLATHNVKNTVVDVDAQGKTVRAGKPCEVKLEHATTPPRPLNSHRLSSFGAVSETSGSAPESGEKPPAKRRRGEPQQSIKGEQDDDEQKSPLGAVRCLGEEFQNAEHRDGNEGTASPVVPQSDLDLTVPPPSPEA